MQAQRKKPILHWLDPTNIAVSGAPGTRFHGARVLPNQAANFCDTTLPRTFLVRLGLFLRRLLAGALAGEVPPRKACPAEFEALAGRSCAFAMARSATSFTIQSKLALAHGVQVGVGRGIHEVDGVGDAVFDGELDGVEVVAERAAELERILLDALEQLRIVGGWVLDIALGVRRRGS